MKLNINHIGAGGLDVARDLDGEAVRALLGGAGVEVAGPRGRAQLRLRLDRVEDTVVVRGRIEATFEVACGSCLGPATVVVDEPDVLVTYLPADSPLVVGSEEERELKAEELDVLTHDGLQVDLEPLVRESLVLAIPIAPRCREECRGICTKCGVDLNEGECDCAPDEEDEERASPWAMALDRIKRDMPS